MAKRQTPMNCRLTYLLKNHPIPWYVHPLLWLLLYHPYAYYFNVIHIPVSHPADAAYLALQQCIVFYPAICWVLPRTWEGLSARWGRAVLGMVMLCWLAEAFIIGVSLYYQQLEFNISLFAAFIYDIENSAWLFPATSATVGVTLLYQTWVIVLNERRRTAQIINGYDQRLDRMATEWYDKQLNPHLLSGLMLIAKNLIVEQSPHAATAFQEIIRILRYYLTIKPHTQLIPLTKELQQGERMKYIKELELDSKLHIIYEVDLPEFADLLIPPMLILMLLKNMFKYGLLTDPKRPARFSIKADGRQLSVKTRNTVSPAARTTDSTRMGMAYIERKLRQLYGDDFTFSHSRIGDEFFVTLRIPVQIEYFR